MRFAALRFYVLVCLVTTPSLLFGSGHAWIDNLNDDFSPYENYGDVDISHLSNGASPGFLFIRLDNQLGSPFSKLPRNLNASMLRLPSGEHFPWYSTSGLQASSETTMEAEQCPWKISSCLDGELTLKFEFLYVDDVDNELNAPRSIHLLSFTPLDSVLGPVTFVYTPDSGRVRAIWAGNLATDAHLPSASIDWTSVALTLKPSTDEMQLFLSTDGEFIEGVSSRITGPQELSETSFGILLGPQSTLDQKVTTFLQVEEEEGLRRSRRQAVWGNAASAVSAINFEHGGGYVSYDFVNRIRDVAGNEEVAIDFIIPTGVKEGLLWLAEGANSKSFIFIRNGRLYYKLIIFDDALGAKMTLTEEIDIDEPLEPGKTHKLRMSRGNDKVQLTLGSSRKEGKMISGRAPLIPTDGTVYLGGSIDPRLTTDGKVTRNFEGKVTAAIVRRNGMETSSVDMLEIIRNPDWANSVKRRGDVKYEYHMPVRRKLAISPTASTRGHAGITLSRTPIPVTFMGTQSSVVRFDTWDFSVYRSFEIEFRTFEPNGVLFFVGPEREHTDFVCVEIFDGNAYFAYGVGNHYRHIQLNPDSIKVNTGTAHRIFVERTPKHKFIVKYNGKEVDVDQGTNAHQTEFASYTYIGSIDQPTRFPWIVWSRENFAGCINFIRINDDNFLDPASRMNQHTDLSRGIQFGVCKAPDLRCNREICGGGQCHERSHPFFEPANFACDCSASDKTFREGIEDIRRSEPCDRDAPLVEFDSETVLMIDFERQMNTLATHTDDINLQFKTDKLNGPLFVAVSTAERQFFQIDLEAGLIKLSTNINQASNPGKTQEFILQSARLNDNKWHTLRIRRRAQYIYMSVDNASEKDDMLIVQIPKGVFNNIAQQIYVGGQMPDNFISPPFTNMAGFLPPGLKFTGYMRNFYWNEYDFFGTRKLVSKYTTEVLTPRLELPTFPSWPREPLYSITCTSGLTYAVINQVIDLEEAGDMWIIEFKTRYDGIVLHARDPNSQSHFSLIILKGRLHFVYSVGGVTGVHEIIQGSITDGVWHRVTFGIDRVKGRFILIFDVSSPEFVGYRLKHETLTAALFHFGGAGISWSEIYEIIRLHAPTAIPSGVQQAPPTLSGCLGGFSSRSDGFLVDQLKKFDNKLESFPPEEIVRGYCRDVVRCTTDYCSNGGICYVVGNTDLGCNCENTGYSGSRCDVRITTCPPNYCSNGGSCRLVNYQPVCDCRNGYYGSQCEKSPCDNPAYCRNGGVCRIENGNPVCVCQGTGYTGSNCETAICPYGYCINGGVCKVFNDQPLCECEGTGWGGPRCNQPICRPGFCMNGGQCGIQNGKPVCDCSNTGYGGMVCEQPICRPGYCLNNGRCSVRNNRPECDCRDTGYSGINCETAICRPGYCLNGGNCVIKDGQSVCDCRKTGYTGQICEKAICQSGLCLNGGRCLIQNDRPVCDCSETGYSGSNCEITICLPGYCLNGGRCSVRNGQPFCDCTNTGYGGLLCEQSICTPDYCQNNGRCTIQGGRPTCDCRDTGYGGSLCEQSICRPGYCMNGGRCVIQGGRPVCDCTNTGYGGQLCEQTLCRPDYCLNGGKCSVRGGRPFCDCSNTDYGGANCEQPVCRPNFCLHGGRCTVQGGRPVCECENTGYRGSNCEITICLPGYCLNGGRCSVRNGQPFCDCTNTGYGGLLCEQSICTPDYCQNNGRCTIQGGRPTCDCRDTGYGGSLCEQSICRPGYCMNGGRCVIQGGRPVCDCTNTGYGGQLCEQTLCRPDYCVNGGRCLVQGGRPVCDCRDTGYEGLNCEQSICRPGYCLHGGRCSIQNGRPVCECSGTGFEGQLCEQAKCYPGFCLNKGRCNIVNGVPICDCRDTGYGGLKCESSICPTGHCLNGGRCVVRNGQPYCDCTGTSYTGAQCSQPICPPSYCLNNGQCYVFDGYPRCNCTGINFAGDRCHYPKCPTDHCLNGGRCFIRPGSTSPECDCSLTGFVGSRCENQVCPDGYCRNGGICRPLPNGQPYCDCSRTTFIGDKCEKPLCSLNYCNGRGTCRVENGRPVCDCTLDFWGPQCTLDVCTAGFCHNGGSCYPGKDRRPHCKCPEGYDGDQCERPKVCPPGYCYHGGVCTMQSGLPFCDCRNTDYQGHRCDVVKTCPAGFCQNGGLCSVVNGRYICDCTNTGYRGSHCSEPIACPINYCLYGGICTILPGGGYSCDCSKTGRSGPNCEGDTNGIYIDYENIGYMVYTLNPPLTTTEDNVTVGFKTYVMSGTILDFLTTDGNHWGIKVRDGQVVIDINGLEYTHPPIVNDGLYHVISMERRGDKLFVIVDNQESVNLPMTRIVNQRDKSLTHSHLYVGANYQKTDIFRGAIGGLYWNGRYPIDEAKGGLQIVTGKVIHVLLPSFILPGQKPRPECPKDHCFNGGICYIENNQLKCDCRFTGWQGNRCERQTRGYLPSVQGNGAFVIIPINPPLTTNVDRMRIAFQTYMKDGPIARFMSTDGTYYEIFMKGQQVFMSENNMKFRLISAPYQQCDDGKMHVITLERNGTMFNWMVDEHRTSYNDFNFVGSNGKLITNEIILGADRDFKNTFTGVLGAFDWNGRLLINDQGLLSSGSNVMIVPGKVSGDKDDVIIVLMPHILAPPIATTVAPPIPFPDGGIPGGGLHGGAIFPPGGGGVVIGSGGGFGGGSSGVFTGAGPILMQAGGGLLSMVNPWLAGLLLLLLPLISALIWACWRCKPGCCPPCVGAGGKGAMANEPGRFANTMDKFKAGLLAGPKKDVMVSIPVDANGRSGAYTALPVGGASIFGTGGPNKLIDITPNSQEPIMAGMHPGMHLDGGPNVYNAEDLKVDCCVLTRNSRYVVTGSASGPPQVWDMQSGEPYKVMDGSELGCNDLHLACGDSLLVGQVVDELQTMDTSTKMHRLQLWNFETGQQMEMPAEILCSVSCVSNGGEHIIAARSTQSFQSIIVWDLPGNQLAREIQYQPLNAQSRVSYINISPEDRFVVAGFTNPIDDQAYFMIFDLSADVQGVTTPKFVVFDAKPEATEILNNDEVVTGTRKGELIVWSMYTGQPLRTININATLEGDTAVTTLPPHTGTIHCVTLSESKTLLVTCAQDRLVRVWTLPDERLLHTLEGHADDVLSAVISYDNEIVVSGSWDGSIRVWRVSDASQMCWFTSNIEVLQVKLSRDKRAIVGLGERSGHRKLIMMQIIRNRTCAPAVYTRSGAHTMSPSSPHILPPIDVDMV